MTEDTNDSQTPFVEDTVLPAANTVYLNAQDKERLTVDIDGYEGPLDVLLSLARVQKLT